MNPLFYKQASDQISLLQLLSVRSNCKAHWVFMSGHQTVARINYRCEANVRIA